MKASHGFGSMSASFDDPNLIGSAGLVAAAELIARTGLSELCVDHIRIRGVANTDAKIGSLVLGMIAGADSIDDMDILRHGAMGRVLTNVRAPSTLGTFLRSFTFGHVRQLEAVASRTFVGLVADQPDLLTGLGSWCTVDIDDTCNPVYGIAKQGAEHGYRGFRGLNALVTTLSTPNTTPVIIGSRLRRGAAPSARGAGKMLADCLAAARRAGAGGQILVRADSAFYRRDVIKAISRSDANFSIVARLDPAVRRSIESIPAQAWTPITYSQAIPDPQTGELVSAAQVAETVHTLGGGGKDPITARLIVRRVPERNTKKIAAAHGAQGELFTVYRYHSVFTDNPMPLIEAEKCHRGHAIIEQVFADLKDSALAHLPSGKFAANGAWLTCAVIAYNLTRAIGVAAGTSHNRARTATIRRQLINLPARISRSARKLHLHMPTNWPWETAWTHIWNHLAPT